MRRTFARQWVQQGDKSVTDSQRVVIGIAVLDYSGVDMRVRSRVASQGCEFDRL